MCFIKHLGTTTANGDTGTIHSEIEVNQQVLPSGTSGDIDSVTRGERGVALVKKFKYCSANVNVTASCISTVTASSSLSTFADCASLILPAT